MRHRQPRLVLLAATLICGLAVAPNFDSGPPCFVQDGRSEVEAGEDTPEDACGAHGAFSGLTLVQVAHAAPDAGASADTGPPTTGELVASGTAAAGAVKDAIKAPSGERFTAWMLAMSAIFSFLILLLRRFGGLLFKRKQVLRLVAIGLGLAAGVVTMLATGAGWLEVLTVTLSGPGAMALQQSLKLLLPAKWATDTGAS